MPAYRVISVSTGSCVLLGLIGIALIVAAGSGISSYNATTCTTRPAISSYGWEVFVLTFGLLLALSSVLTYIFATKSEKSI
ncbi:MAG: hypothetical protein Sylvanvirus1_62 [Sylvanvirus sp.]|uniref:Uncharacterized protein n=1 Tax=Sylvanvirus sp. TaxID=2487774 RepID=A0A3G5AGX0_9VIRU|nr:MAG: hypothetical protein Sylvanvirus1_62 [Sylvanvirus sp.]